MKAVRALGLISCGAVMWACGSSDSNKKARDADGGAGGETSSSDAGATDGGSPDGAGAEGGTGASDAGAPSQIDAGEGGGGSVPAGVDLYVSPTGSDEAPGTEAEPFLTIAHAAELAKAADRIHLLDGTFDSATQPSFATNQPIALAPGVTLMAENPGQAVLTGETPASVALAFSGPGELQNVRFSSFGTAVRASQGMLTITGLNVEDFDDPSAVPLDLSGTAQVSLTPGAVESYVSNGYFFASVTDSASLSIEGGAFESVSGVANLRGIFDVRGDAELTLSGVDVVGSVGEVIFATDTAKVSLLANTIIEGTLTPALANIELQGQSELVMDESELTDAYWAHISTIGAPTLDISGSAISGAGSWGLIVNTDGVAGTVAVTIDDTVIAENNAVLGQIDVRRAADLVITNSRIIDGLQAGIFLSDVAVNLLLRGSTVSGNGQSGVRISGHADSTCDLGTVDDPGENTLLGNGTSQPALLSYLPAGKTCYAVGNTWAPNVQGASSAGEYSATGGSGGVLEITGLENSGLNYWVVPVGSILRLAENP